MAAHLAASLLALSALAVAALPGCGTSCGAVIECRAPLVVVAHLAVPLSSNPPLSVVFCRNGACSEGALSSSSATLAGAFRVDVVATTVNDGATDVTLTPAFDGYVDGSGDVADGDSYVLRVTSGTTVLVDDTRTIDFTHSSAGCRDGSCYGATYDVG